VTARPGGGLPPPRWFGAGHRLPVLIAAILVLILIIGIGSKLLVSDAQLTESRISADLGSGQSRISAARSLLLQGTTTNNPDFFTQGKLQIARARTDFTDAVAVIDQSQLLGDAKSIPVATLYVSPRIRAVDGLVALGLALCDAMRDQIPFDELLATPPIDGRGGSSRLIEVLQQSIPTLQLVEIDLDRASTALEMVDDAVVPSAQRATVLKARNDVAAGLAGIGGVISVIPVLSQMLGSGGPRDYLVEQINPIELRPGGGLFGTYSVLHAADGSLSLRGTGNVYDLINPRPKLGGLGYLAPPQPLAPYFNGTSWSLVDSNLFPDFPSNAMAAEQLDKLGYPVQGVVAIDYQAVAELLKLTGPIDVPAFQTTVSADNFVSQAIAADLASSRMTSDQNESGHKQFIAAVAGPLLQKVANLPAGLWVQVIQRLGSLAASRHIQAYLNDPAGEAQLDRFGWSGVLNPHSAPDFLAEVEANLGGNKDNNWLVRSYDLELTASGSTLHHHLVVHLTNPTPPPYENRYQAYVRIYTASSAKDLKFGSLETVTAPSAYGSGTSFEGGWLDMTPEPNGVGRHDITFDYDTAWPGTTREYTIYWQKQPGSTNDRVKVTWNTGQATFRVSAVLGSDMTVRVTPDGVSLNPAQPALVSIPSVGF
jgi:hypothetical protein